MRALLYTTPVDVSKRDWRAFKGAARLLWQNRRIGSNAYRIVDLLTQSVHDYLSRWFEHDTIKALLGYYASIGTFAGPKSPSTAYVLMHHLMGEHSGAGGWGFIRGGMGAISDAIMASGARFGLERGRARRSPRCWSATAHAAVSYSLQARKSRRAR